MSCVYKGSVIDTNLSRNARGGTEQMRKRLLDRVNPELLSRVAIHLSRPRDIYNDVPNILWCHDLSSDPENAILLNSGWKKFDHFVFVTNWQKDQYIDLFGIPSSKCTVIQNSVELNYTYKEKPTDKINFIYHTTPHRGLQLLYPIFDRLSKSFDNIHLNVFSSFEVYGWKERDRPYQNLFEQIKAHPNMTYHGAKSNSEVLKALDETHIFLYPCIWQETSCIALIEAVRSGCICIHPNYGALTETAAGATIVYDYNSDPSAHATIAYSIAYNVLSEQQKNKDLFNKITSNALFELPLNSMPLFVNSWDTLLEKVLHER